MKTRVYKYGAHFYPQYKDWVFWKYIWEFDGFDAQVAKHFNIMTEAIDFLKKKEWKKYSEVVWQSK